MLKQRLIFGTLITVLFAGIVILDGWIDGSFTFSPTDDKPAQATLLCILISLLAIPAQIEMSKLVAAKKIKVFTIVSIPASILLSTWRYWPQFFDISPELYLSLVLTFSFLAVFLYQFFRYDTSDVLTNCGVTYFSIIYLGLLSSFILAIRIDFGLWPLLMFVFVVKSSDIGAYTVGKLFGKHKFSPKISPKKTWEGIAGAVIMAVIIAVLFAHFCDIMTPLKAAVFGFCFAFIGQFGDLAESMIKRDVEQKDSSKSVPGFGGILDIIDSPLVAAVFAYVFFIYWLG